MQANTTPRATTHILRATDWSDEGTLPTPIRVLVLDHCPGCKFDQAHAIETHGQGAKCCNCSRPVDPALVDAYDNPVPTHHAVVHGATKSVGFRYTGPEGFTVLYGAACDILAEPPARLADEQQWAGTSQAEAVRNEYKRATFQLN